MSAAGEPGSRLAILACLALAGCVAWAADKVQDAKGPVADAGVNEDLSAGSYTVPPSGPQSYSIMVGGLPPDQARAAQAGRRMFNDVWVLPTEVIGVWGVGPTFNENSCAQCHPANGRARAPAHGQEVASGALLRLSVPGLTEHGAPNPHPHYGDQFQNRGVKGRVPAEGRAFVHYENVSRRFADGTEIVLRRPRVTFDELNFGELGADTRWSLRIAPALAGLGLLEAVPEANLLALREGQAAQGMEGTPNYVWDIEAGRAVFGRFGWKANQPNLRQQTAAALHGDIGATSELFPAENCRPVQADCYKGPTATGCNGGHDGCQDTNFWEVLPSRLRNMTLYLQALGVPARRDVGDPRVQRGAIMFSQARCDVCHIPELTTGSHAAIASAAGHTIRPYTDLLLHDMGEDLADHRPDFRADGRQWRTPPLWGLGLQPAVNGHMELLHDGRARNFVEAILWHGGQALPARDAFASMSRSDREALVRFLEAI